jgi:hypothetical protein
MLNVCASCKRGRSAITTAFRFRAISGRLRGNKGAATSLHFPVAVMPERHSESSSQPRRLSGKFFCEHQPRRAALIAATSIFFMPIMAANARLLQRRRPPSPLSARAV